MNLRIAGSDTSSTTATFAIKLLLEHPLVLQTLVEELDSAFPSKSSPITMERIQNLTFLNAVINETLRLKPILPTGKWFRASITTGILTRVLQGISRMSPEPRVVNGYEIPKDASLSYLSSREHSTNHPRRPDHTAHPNHSHRPLRLQLPPARAVPTRALARTG